MPSIRIRRSHPCAKCGLASQHCPALPFNREASALNKTPRLTNVSERPDGVIQINMTRL